MSELIDKIAKERYLRDGEQTMSDVYGRVASTIAEAVPSQVYPYGEHCGSMSDSQRQDAWDNIFYNLMVSGTFLPNTPTLSNAGTKCQMLSACFGLPVNDSFFDTGGIMDGIVNSVKIMKMGGGVGYNFSNLRPAGSVVASTDGVASGPVSFMKFYNAAVDVVKQGGRRRGAAIGILNTDHPDIKEFLTCKAKEGEISNMNLSVMITNQFMEDVMRPDIELGEMSHLLDDSHVARIKRNKEIFNMIVDGIWNNGEPGLLFYDTINRDNPNNHLYDITTCNPCGELPIGVDPATGGGEACNLGSINVSKFYNEITKTFEWTQLEAVVYSAVVFLDTVIDVNEYPTEAIGKMARDTRKIGLGFMGLHDLFIKMRIPYDSQEARNTASTLMEFISKVATDTSMELATIEGVYPEWEGSTWWATGNYIRNSTLTCVAPTGTLSLLAECSSGIEPYFNWVYERHNTVGSSFLMSVPLFEEEIERVVRDISENDVKKILYHDFNVVCFDLTDEYVDGDYKWLIQYDDEKPGNIYEKLVDCVKQYCYANGTISNLFFLPEATRIIFRNAMDIKYDAHIRMQAAVQKYCDNSISKTINMPNVSTKEDVRNAINLAWASGCKGFTMYRDGSRQDVVLKLKESETKEVIVNQPVVAGQVVTKDMIDPEWQKMRKTIEEEEKNRELTTDYIETMKETIDNGTTGSKFKRVLPATRYRVSSGCGDLYIHVTEEDGRVREVFVNCGSSGGCAANNNAIGRLISLALKHKVPIRDIIRQLKKVKCDACLKNGSAEGKSCADVIGRVLEECIPEEEEMEHKIETRPNAIQGMTVQYQSYGNSSGTYYNKNGTYCPECGTEIKNFEGRCYTCPNCAYSKCG